MNYLRQLNIFGKIADIPYDLIGTTDPTSATEARSGMGYFNKLSRAFFICVDDTPGAYIWIKVAGGGNSSENTGSGEPGVGITSITPVSTSDESNGVNIYAINLTDGSSYNIEVRNGSAGKDYVLTEADKAEIAGMVDVPTISDVEVVQMWGDNPENDTYAIRITCDDGSEYTAELPALITDPSRVVILHDGTPTDSTEGAKHQLLVDIATLNIYVCLGSSGIGAMTYYTWQQIQGAVTSVNGKTGAVQLSASDVGALPNTTKIPSKTSDLQNDSGFVGNTVSNLTNYYLKSETYTRDEVTALIAAVKTYTVSVVSELPSTGAEKVIYLVVKADGSDKDAHNEYLWVNGKFEFIGTTAVDLTGYAKEDWVSGQLTNCLKTTDLQSAIDTALAQAKECGEFDGEPGVSPTVSVADITGGHRVTITDKEGTKTVDVMDGSNGDPGDPGRGITSVQRTSGTGAAGTTDIYTITYSDSTTSTFTVYNGANGDDYTLTEADKTEIAQQAAALVDVDGVVKSTEQTFTDGEKAQVRTNIGAAATTDLLNYYTKSQTYTQEEIRTLVSAIPKFTISVVNVLPTTDISTTTVYLVKSGSDTDLYTEYIFIVDGNAPENGDGTYDETSGTWEILGSQRVDLTGYATEEWVNLRLAEFVTADKIVDLLGYTPVKESEIPTKVSQLENDSGYAKQTEVNQLSDAIADYVTPEKYGAKADGTTDDTAAIQAAIDAAGGNGTVYLQNKTYLIENGLIINSAYAQLVCDGLIKYTGTGSAVAIKPTGGASLSRVDVRINRLEAENGTGVILDASDGKLTSIYVDVNYIYKCKIGVQLLADNEYYISYGVIKSKEIKATETGIHVENKGSGEGISFLNEVFYYLGRILGGCKTGVKLINAGAHKFMSGSFEGLADDATSLYLENASDNMFRNFRWAETYGSTRIKFVGDCHYNDIEGSRMTLSEIDISELAEIGGQYNILRAPFIMNEKHGYRCGNIAYVNKQQGITYLPNYDDNSFVRLTADTAFDSEGVIGRIENRILTSVRCDSADIDGLTYTLSDIYSGFSSASRGFPISFEFGAVNGKIKLIDAKGIIILDNTNGEYAGKTVTVKWCGYNYHTQKNTWLIQEQGEVAATERFVRECLKSQSRDIIVQSNGGNEFKIVVTDGGLLTTIPNAEINQVPISKDTDGSVYNGAGYIDGYRINSSGANAAASNTLVTGYMPVTGGNTVLMSAWDLMNNLINENAFAVYDANFANLGVFTAKGVGYGIFSDTHSAYGFSSITETDGVYSWIVPSDANIAYIRLSAYKADGKTLSVIVDKGDNVDEQTPIVESVNGKTGAVQLSAEDVGARPSTWMPSASDVGADPVGTASGAVSVHNTSDAAHNDIRLLITGLTNWLHALANSTDEDLDQMAEVVAFIKANKSLIESITTSKVNVADIIDNFTTNVSNKPLSARMGVELKKLIDAIKIPTSLPASDVYDWAKEPKKPKYTAADVGALASASHTTKLLTVTYEDGTSDTFSLVVTK